MEISSRTSCKISSRESRDIGNVDVESGDVDVEAVKSAAERAGTSAVLTA